MTKSKALGVVALLLTAGAVAKAESGNQTNAPAEAARATVEAIQQGQTPVRFSEGVEATITVKDEIYKISVPIIGEKGVIIGHAEGNKAGPLSVDAFDNSNTDSIVLTKDGHVISLKQAEADSTEALIVAPVPEKGVATYFMPDAGQPSANVHVGQETVIHTALPNS